MKIKKYLKVQKARKKKAEVIRKKRKAYIKFRNTGL